MKTIKTKLLIGLLIINGIANAQSGEALNFDGVNDNVNLNHFSRTLDITLEAWIKTTSNSTMQIIGWAGTTGNSAEFKFNTGTIGYFEWDGASFPGVSSVNPLNDNIWHHVAVVRTSATFNNVSIYVDGLLDNFGTVDLTIVTNALNIGAYNYFGLQQFYDGTLDDIRIWDRALTSTEIFNNYNCELSPGQTGLVGYYKFNQGISGANNSGINTLVDSSGLYADGTLNSFNLNGVTSNWVAPGALNCFTAINEQVSSSMFSVYPNPFSSQTTLYSDKILKDAILTIYSCAGQTVKQIKNISGQTVILSRDNLPSGLYFLQLTQDNKIIAADKLVITN